MYELIKINDRDYYIQSPTRIGLVKLTDSEVCIIDSGCDKDVGKKILRIIKENEWTLKSIYITHSHADHIGGNKYLQEQTGCSIYANGIECDFVSHPILEPISLFAGNPFKELRNKFLLAPESTVTPLSQDNIPDGFEIVHLPGHSFDMVGFRTPNNTLFLADALSSKETLDKYKVGFVFDVGAYLNTLEMVKQMKADLFVPSHVEPCESIDSLAQYNIDKTNEIADTIIEICSKPICFEDALQRIFDSYEITMTHQQYVLVGSTVRSYFSWLKETGKIEIHIENNKLLWVKSL